MKFFLTKLKNYIVNKTRKSNKKDSFICYAIIIIKYFVRLT